MARPDLGPTIERRIAMIIGNSAYRHAGVLKNPVNDARAMARVLGRLGFEVVQGANLGLEGIGDALGEFESRLHERPDVALLYYAGHGLQVDGRNYLVPIDVQISQKTHLSTRAVLLSDILDEMAASASTTLLFLDACRENPFSENIARSLGQTGRSMSVRGGLAPMERAGTFIAYATAPDHLAFDGAGQNSPFTSALLQHIEMPGLSVGDMMIDVRNKVIVETKGKQQPWDQSSLRTRFFFVPPEPQQPQPSFGATGEQATNGGATSPAVLARVQEQLIDASSLDYSEAHAIEQPPIEAARHSAEDAEPLRVDTHAIANSELHSKGQAATSIAAADGEQSVAKSTVDRQGTSKLSRPELIVSIAIAAIGSVLAITDPWKPQPRPAPPAADVALPPLDRDASSCRGIRTEVAGKGSVCLDPSDAVKREFQDCNGNFCGPQMVALQTGSYLQGDETNRDRREVTIGYHIAVGKFEVTFAEWDGCVADGGCKWNPGDEGWGRGRRPVINVSWNDIGQQYLPWLNRKLGRSGTNGYRLLTEAEWEYAARAGTTRAYSFGDKLSITQARLSLWGWGGVKEDVEVGTFPANPFGLHDMHGNVSEWVQDCYANSYAKVRTDGGKAPETKDCSRVYRGGSWVNAADALRAGYRFKARPDNRSTSEGFRLARTFSLIR